MTKLLRLALFVALAPMVTLAAIVGTLYVKDIIGGNGLENTRSSDEDPIRQQATTAIIVQRENITGRNPNNQFKIVYKDGGTETCTGAGLSSMVCALVPGTLTGPMSSGDGGGAGEGFIEPVCVITSFTPYGHWAMTVVSQGPDSSVSEFGYVVDGYTANYSC